MKLPIVNPKGLIKVALKLGFIETRQKGSHKIFSHADGRKLTIPFHSNKPVPPGLLNKIIKQDLRISRDEFSKLL
jgi:predicted RNA binding protein YcfA (HicA-like mRNA interferase family)